MPRERELDQTVPTHSEHILRDFLAEHLDLVEPNLTLVDTEYHLANDQGASGSIDILARDASGDLVVIELKRLDQTARQALHELEKYVGLLAADRGIRVDRLRCVLLSTTWHELLVPFARFVSHADFYASGRLLKLGEDGYPIGNEVVELPELASGLETCPVHLNLLFGSQEARDAAKETVADAVNDMCVEDYITVDLDYVGVRIPTSFTRLAIMLSSGSSLRCSVSSRAPSFQRTARTSPRAARGGMSNWSSHTSLSLSMLTRLRSAILRGSARWRAGICQR